MKLNTLKELTYKDYDTKGKVISSLYCRPQHLKQEAIKWIKFFIKERPIPKPNFKWEFYSPTCFNCNNIEQVQKTDYESWNGKIHFIKHFFNITEDDLK